MTKFDVNHASAWMGDFATRIQEHAAELTELDRQIGDADHGSNMERGMKAVSALETGDFASAGEYIKKAAMVLLSSVGGASGPLYGTLLLRFARELPDADPDLTPELVARCFRAGLEGVVQRGKAAVGDKTMVDALTPAVEALEETAPQGLAAALAAATEAAVLGRNATIPLQARKGRASYLGERSVGHQDPGATSLALLVEAATATLT